MKPGIPLENTEPLPFSFKRPLWEFKLKVLNGVRSKISVSLQEGICERATIQSGHMVYMLVRNRVSRLVGIDGR
jgi:hypothetical protein